jgi:hypothetical protein
MTRCFGWMVLLSLTAVCGPRVSYDLLGAYTGVVAGTLVTGELSLNDAFEGEVVLTERAGKLVVLPKQSRGSSTSLVCELVTIPISDVRYELDGPITCTFVDPECSGLLTAQSGALEQTSTGITATAQGTVAACDRTGTFTLTYSAQKTPPN